MAALGVRPVDQRAPRSFSTGGSGPCSRCARVAATRRPPSSSSRARRCRPAPSPGLGADSDVNDGSPPGLSTPSQRVIEWARGSASATSRGTRGRSRRSPTNRPSRVASPCRRRRASSNGCRRSRHRDDRSVDDRGDERARRRVLTCRPSARPPPRRVLRGLRRGVELRSSRTRPCPAASTVGRPGGEHVAGRAGGGDRRDVAVGRVSRRRTRRARCGRRTRRARRVLVPRMTAAAVAHRRDVGRRVAR